MYRLHFHDSPQKVFLLPFTSSEMPRSPSSHPAGEMGSRVEARSSKPLFLITINPRPTIPRKPEQVCQATSTQAQPAILVRLAAPGEVFLPSLSPRRGMRRGSEKKSCWKNCGFKRQPTGLKLQPSSPAGSLGQMTHPI